MCTLQEFISYLRFERRFSAHTIKAYRTDLFQFESYLSCTYDAQLLEAEDVMVRSWVVEMIENGCSKRSLNRKLTSLRQFYKYALKNRKLAQSPMIQINSLKVPAKLPSFISEEEMRQLLENVVFPEGYVGERDKAILEMFYCTGIRLSELIGLKLEDIDFNNLQIKVFGKRAKERLIPLLESHAMHLKSYLNYRLKVDTKSIPYLFLTESGNVLYPKLVYGVVNSYLREVTGVKQKSPHVLRHAFAIHMLNDGADLNAIKEVLGHTSLSSTQIYTRSSLERLKEVYKQAHPRGD